MLRDFEHPVQRWGTSGILLAECGPSKWIGAVGATVSHTGVRPVYSCLVHRQLPSLLERTPGADISVVECCVDGQKAQTAAVGDPVELGGLLFFLFS